jgi:hypothetical protein
MSPRHQGATVHELARVTELAGLPGEVLSRLAETMERRELRPGERLDAGARFGVVLAGLVGGAHGLLRPGDTFEGAVAATTPATIATCDRESYDEIVAPR